MGRQKEVVSWLVQINYVIYYEIFIEIDKFFVHCEPFNHRSLQVEGDVSHAQKVITVRLHPNLKL